MTTATVHSFHDLHRNDDIPAPQGAQTSSPLGAIADGIRLAVARVRYRRTVLELARFRPHLLRDIGFEPDAVYEAARGDWRAIDARGRRG